MTIGTMTLSIVLLMPSVTDKPIMLSVIVLIVAMLSDVEPFAPYGALLSLASLI